MAAALPYEYEPVMVPPLPPGAEPAAPETRSLTESVLRGLVWAFLGTGGQGLLKVPVLMILARLLTPEQFGVVSAALIVVGVSSIFSQLGVGPAVVQRPNLDRAHLRAGFTLSILLGAVTTALFYLMAPVAGGFFRLPQLVPVMRVLSIVFVVQGVSVVAESLLLRGLEFRRLANVDLVAFGLGYGAVGVVMALLRFGVWALVGAQIAQSILRTGLLLAFQPHPKAPLLQRRAVGNLLYFGGGHTAARVGNYAANQADNVVVGRWLGAIALGTYDRAYALMAAPAMFLGEMLDRVLFPAMVKVQDDRRRLAKAYLRSVSVTALVMLPASAVLLVLGPEVVRLALGRGWEAVVAPFQVFACGLLLRTSYKMSDSLARATGAVYHRAWRQAAYAALVCAGAWFGHPWGLEGVALGVLIAIAANFVLMAHLSLRLTGTPVRALWVAHRHAVGLAMLAGFEAWLVAHRLRDQAAPPLLVFAAGAGAPFLTLLLLLAIAPRFAFGAEGAWVVRKLAPHWSGRARDRAGAGTLEEASAEDEADSGPGANGTSRPQALPSGMLELVRDLTARLEQADVRYCQFKSNQHLDEGLRGATDLDLLVERGAAHALARILVDLDFKRFTAPPGGVYPAVEDYLGMDPASGRLVHLHLHYQLTTGERHLKGYRLPWEEMVLSTRCRDWSTGFYVSDPSVEFLLLMSRMTLKLRPVDAVRATLRRDPIGADVRAEYDWLASRARSDTVRALALPLLGAEGTRAMLALLESGLTHERILELRRAIRPRLRLYRSYTLLGAFAHRWLRTARALNNRLGRRYPQSAGPISRLNPRGGMLIAILGSDGSGKSTLTGDLASWLGWKVDARVIYFGSGDGQSSLLRRPLKFALWVWVTLRRWRGKGGGRRNGTRTGFESRARVLWALVLAGEKRRTLRRAWRARNRGIMVMCDRYPQNQLAGMNDGPLLRDWGRSAASWQRALARWESVPYEWADALAPDLVIKLHVSPEVARHRKPDMDLEEIERRDSAIRSFRYPPGTRVIEVDTDRPLEAVRLDVRREVWKAL